MSGLNSDAYLDAIIEALKDFGIYDNLFFLCTDGAAVVASGKNGLYGKLKDRLNHLIGTKCFAHKVSLGAKDLAKEFVEI